MKLHIYHMDNTNFTRNSVAVLISALKVLFKDLLDLDEVTETRIIADLKDGKFTEEDEYDLAHLLNTVAGDDNLTIVLLEQHEEHKHVA